jgi:hypothetical protein
MRAAFLHAEQPLKQTLVKGFRRRGDVRHQRPAAVRTRLRRFVVIVTIAFASCISAVSIGDFPRPLLLLPIGLRHLVAAPLAATAGVSRSLVRPFGKGYQLSYSLIAFGRASGSV